jgi:MFS family permease
MIEQTKPSFKNYAILFAMSLAMLVLAFNTTALVNSLLIIRQEFNISATSLQWVINIYILMAATFILAAGKLGDYFERKKIFIFSCIFYLFASVLIALCQNTFQLILGRGLQGLAAAFICSGSMTIIKTQFEKENLIWAVGIWSAMIGVGCAIGPFGGGIISDMLTWRYIFWLNALITLIAMLVTIFYFDKTSIKKRKIEVDYIGLFLFLAAAGSIVFAFSYSNVIGWGNFLIPFLIILGLLLLIVFYKYEIKKSEPLVHFKFFRNKVFLFANIGIFSIIFCEMAIPYFFNLYMQNSSLLNYSASESGVLLLPFTVVIFIFSLTSAFFVKIIGPKKIIICSFAVVTIGLLFFAYAGLSMYFHGLIIGMFLCGLAIGSVNPLLASIALSSLPEENIGEASGLLNTIAYFAELAAITIGNIIFFTVGRNILSPILNVSSKATSDSFDRLLIGYKSHISSFMHIISPDTKGYAFDLIQKSAKFSFSSIILFTAILTFCVGLISIFWILMNKKDKMF